ncbi:MAG: hypothetical protein ACW99J_13965, partial [Candidatus Thorarchaeota archaeon]
SKGNPDRIPTAHIHVVIGVVRASLKRNILPMFVFDGPPETLKRSSNPELVALAAEIYKEFSDAGTPFIPPLAGQFQSVPALGWYFAVNHIKDLCKAIGIPAITAPSEAEMMAAVLCNDGKAGTVVSNDVDSLLFGSPHVSRSLRLTQEEIERATLSDLESATGLDINRLRDLAIICGCDFSDGVKGVGPRKGIALLTRFDDLESVLKYKGYDPLEREQFLKARSVFDEPDQIPVDSVQSRLNAPLIPRLAGLLAVVMGEERAERTTRELVKAWKGFGREQTTLEAWT